MKEVPTYKEKKIPSCAIFRMPACCIFPVKGSSLIIHKRCFIIFFFLSLLYKRRRQALPRGLHFCRQGLRWHEQRGVENSFFRNVKLGEKESVKKEVSSILGRARNEKKSCNLNSSGSRALPVRACVSSSTILKTKLRTNPMRHL